MKSVAVDFEDGMTPAKPRAYKTVRPVNKSMFKLRDPKTGLFWGVSSSKTPMFNNIGKSWSTRKSAMRNWAEYNFEGMLASDNRAPLELAVFEVTTVEQNVIPVCDISMERVAKVEAVLGKNAGHYGMIEFLKNIARENKFNAAYVIDAEGNREFATPSPVPANIKFRDNLQRSSGLSTDQSTYLLLALESFTDLAFMRMAISENIVAIYDIDEIIARYDGGERHDRKKRGDAF
jgi:hypothetical protein